MSKAENELAAYVTELLDREMDRQRKYHGDWFTNLAYGAGKQWCVFDEQYGVVRELTRTRSWQVRVVLNRINSIVWQVVAQIISPRPHPQAVPRSSNESDRMAARGWQTYYDHLWRSQKMRQLCRDQLIPWVVYCSLGWLRTGWDPNAGGVRTLSLPADPTPEEANEVEADNRAMAELPPQMMAAVLEATQAAADFRTMDVSLGDVTFKCPSPFNVFMDPSALTVDDAAWILECSFTTPQKVRETYGVRKIEADVDSSGITTSYTPRIKQGMLNFASWVSSSLTGRTKAGEYVKGVGLEPTDEAEEQVLLKEWWLRPNKKYPKGRYIVTANNRVLREDDNPYDGALPYSRLLCDPQCGSAYGGALVSHMRDLQSMLNRMVSQRVQDINFYGRPQWMVPTACKVDLAHVNEKPGGVLPYATNPQGAKPERLNAPYLGSWFQESVGIILTQLDEIAGLRKASRGLNPEGVRSARALNELQEADQEGRAPLQERFQETVEDSFRIATNIAKKYIREDRLLRVIGGDGIATAWEFTRAQVEAGFDVTCEFGPGLPKSVQGRLAAVGSMIQAGLIDLMDPKQKATALRALEFGEFAAMLDGDEGPERERIHAENLSMLTGNPVPVKNYDLHEEHKTWHSRFMRSAEAQSMFKLDPSLEQVFVAHLDQHIDWTEIPPANGVSPVPIPEDMMAQSSAAGGPATPGAADVSAPLSPESMGSPLETPGGMTL